MKDIALKELVQGKHLNSEETKELMEEITEGKLSEIQIAAFLTALKLNGETVEEITAAAKVMKEKCIKTNLKTVETLDIVGTGGDMSNTFNISTAASFVVAACDVPVAKHGNRALTSKSGSIDVLEALGINVNKTPQEEKFIFDKLNICFMFAKNHHPAMKAAAEVRKQLPFRTIFNILGPLTNPACASSQLFGVYSENLVLTLAQVISNLGVKNALVIHGKDGLDEATLTDETVIAEVRDGKIINYTINPGDFNLKRCKKEDLIGADRSENAKIIKNIFSGEEKGAKRDIVVLNSALALYTFKKVNSVQDGINLAINAIDKGLALDKLNKYIEISQ